MNQLIFFTTHFPHGIGEPWKSAEVEAFATCGWDVHVVPLYGAGSISHDAMRPDVTYHQPLTRAPHGVIGLRPMIRVALSSVREVFTAASGRPRTRRLRAWAASTTLNLRALSALSRIRLPPADRRILYFFWGRGAAEALPAIRSVLGADACVVRLHGYDLYEDRSPAGYLPFRHAVWSADRILVVSEAGRAYVRQHAPQTADRLQLRRLGTVAGAARSDEPHDRDGVVRIVSCSSITEVKRVASIPRLLRAMPSERFSWTHIGDGPLRSDVEDALRDSPNVQGRVTGQVDSRVVREILSEHHWDLFVNVSSSEGVPVSVMEALASGVPVVATDVGGTGEIIDTTVGRLVSGDLDAEEFAEAVLDVVRADDRAAMRRRCIQRHAEMCDERNLTRRLVAEVFEPLANAQPR